MHHQEDQIATLGAGALVYYQNHVLLVQINYGRYQGSWILPGGMVQPDEHPHEAAVRETKEETGLDIQISEQIAVRHRIHPDHSVNVYFVFRGALLPHAKIDLSLAPEAYLSWPPAELLAVRFWDIDEAQRSEAIRPQTRKFILLGLENSGPAHRPLAVHSDPIYRDSIFGKS